MRLNTAQKVDVAQQLIDGVPQRQIAASVGMSQPSISVYKKSIEPQIIAAQTKLINEGLNNTVDTTVKILQLGQQLTDLLHTCNTNTKYKQLKSMAHKMALMGTTGKDMLILADKKGERLGKSVGIEPSHTNGSPTVNNWIMGDITVNNVVDPGVQAALGSQLDGILSTDDIIDADYTDDMSNIEGQD